MNTANCARMTLFMGTCRGWFVNSSSDRLRSVRKQTRRSVAIPLKGNARLPCNKWPHSAPYFAVSLSEAPFHRIVIYHREYEDTPNSELFQANCAAYVGLDEDRRYTISLTEIRHLGTTASAWSQFAATNRNPIRYFTRLGLTRLSDCWCRHGGQPLAHVETLATCAAQCRAFENGWSPCFNYFGDFTDSN